MVTVCIVFGCWGIHVQIMEHLIILYLMSKMRRAFMCFSKQCSILEMNYRQTELSVSHRLRIYLCWLDPQSQTFVSQLHNSISITS